MCDVITDSLHDCTLERESENGLLFSSIIDDAVHFVRFIFGTLVYLKFAHSTDTPMGLWKEDFSNFLGHSLANTRFLQPCKRNCYSLLPTVTPSIDSCNVVNSTNPLTIGRLRAMLIPYDCNNSADFWLIFGGWRALWGYFVG